MSAHGAVIPPAPPRERVKDVGFRALLMLSTVAGVGVLGLLLYDVAADGRSKLQVSLRVVFPAALSGIVAAVVLGVSRAIGETMIVLVAAGQIPNMAADPGEPHATMTAFIAGTAKGDVPTGSIGYETIFAVGATLFFLTLAMNAIAIRFVRRYRQVYE